MSAGPCWAQFQAPKACPTAAWQNSRLRQPQAQPLWPCLAIPSLRLPGNSPVTRLLMAPPRPEPLGPAQLSWGRGPANAAPSGSSARGSPCSWGSAWPRCSPAPSELAAVPPGAGPGCRCQPSTGSSRALARAVPACGPCRGTAAPS